jgi:hypothetical protein
MSKEAIMEKRRRQKTAKRSAPNNQELPAQKVREILT